jgi:hypothetical protein
MNVSTGVALAATLGGPAVGAIAIIVGRLNSRDALDNAHQLARGSRRFDTRSQVYEDLLCYILSALDHADHVMVTVAENPLAAIPSSDHLTEQERQVQIRTAIFGSAEVSEAALAFFSEIRGVIFQATLSLSTRRRGGDVTESARSMHKSRDDAGDLLLKIQKMMREELEGL